MRRRTIYHIEKRALSKKKKRTKRTYLGGDFCHAEEREEKLGHTGDTGLEQKSDEEKIESKVIVDCGRSLSLSHQIIS